MYAVFTGTGINPGGGFGTEYCAYHAFFTDAMGRNVKYAAMPYDYDALMGCTHLTESGSPNNDPPADAEVNPLAHELAETITDENGNGWFVSSGPSAGSEMADLCDVLFGPLYPTANGAQANQSLAGKNFLVQMLWVNVETAQGTQLGCEQTFITPPSASRRRPRTPTDMTAPPGPLIAGRHIMRMYKAGRGSVAAARTRTGAPS
jgi:hypothetical protein